MLGETTVVAPTVLAGPSRDSGPTTGRLTTSNNGIYGVAFAPPHDSYYFLVQSDFLVQADGTHYIGQSSTAPRPMASPRISVRRSIR